MTSTAASPALTDADQALREPVYVLIKRGLYWRPDGQGYTGVLADAGRYTEGQARPYIDNPGYDVTVMLASQAGEFSPACWEETKRNKLKRDVETAEARATAAEDKLRDREAEIERLRNIALSLVTYYQLLASGPPTTLRTIVDAARAALASTDHPASSEEATDVSGS